jgi:serine/threonine protein kinase
MLVDDLILTKSLGKGSFGEVFLTQKKDTNEFYAAKRLDRAYSEKPENMKRLTKEISILKAINHPNIVKIIQLKKTKTHIYIVTEYCNGGSLSKCLSKYTSANFKPFPEKIVQYLMRQILNAICYLHSKKIIHRDLKLDNILVIFPTEQDKQSLNMMSVTVKLIDFGFATVLRSAKANLTYTVLGTPTNMDPHLLKNIETRTRNQEGYDEKVDIWSLGTLCYEMLVGRMAFGGRHMEDLYKNIEKANYTLPVNLSKEAVSFINAMLQNDLEKRLSAAELLKHDFLVKNYKDFQPIDTTKIENKISGNAININFKDNQTIWKMFNQDNGNNVVNYANYENYENYDNNKANYMNNIYEEVVEVPQQNKQINQKKDVGNHHHHTQPNQNEKQEKYAKVTRLPPQNKNNYQKHQHQHNYQHMDNQGFYTIPEINSENQGEQPYTDNQGIQDYMKGVEGYIINEGEIKSDNKKYKDFYYQDGNYNI